MKRKTMSSWYGSTMELVDTINWLPIKSPDVRKIVFLKTSIPIPQWKSGWIWLFSVFILGFWVAIHHDWSLWSYSAGPGFADTLTHQHAGEIGLDAICLLQQHLSRHFPVLKGHCNKDQVAERCLFGPELEPTCPNRPHKIIILSTVTLDHAQRTMKLALTRVTTHTALFVCCRDYHETTLHHLYHSIKTCTQVWI